MSDNAHRIIERAIAEIGDRIGEAHGWTLRGEDAVDRFIADRMRWAPERSCLLTMRDKLVLLDGSIDQQGHPIAPPEPRPHPTRR